MLQQFRAEIAEASEAGISVRVIPYGKTISHMGQQISFSKSAVVVPSSVIPLTVDHGDGVTERIGKLEQWAETDDGLYGQLSISDTQLGRETRQLMLDGVVTDVSAGVAIDASRESETNGVLQRAGTLDHVSVVAKGAFGEAGSRVLAVHSEEGGSTVSNTKEAPQVEPETDGQGDLMLAKMDELSRVVAELSIPGAIKEEKPETFGDLRDFVLTLALAQKGDQAAIARVEEYVLADDTTVTAAGVVPDFLASRVIETIDTSRPYLNTLQRDPIGTHGMTLVYPNVVSGPSVAVQIAEKTEVDSTAMDIDPLTVDLLTYAGASDVARQLVERSQPSFVDILFRHYANAYAQLTDGDAVDAGVAGAANTAILADLGADAALTFAAISAANADVIAAVRKPATHIALAADRWNQLNNLLDADGRPLLVFPNNGPMNAVGQSSFVATAAQYHGLIAYLDANATTGACLVYNADEYAFWVEQSPQQLRAEVVSLLGFEMGVYGLFAHKVQKSGAGSTLTLA